MRLTRLSLVAAMLIGSTAFAIDNIKMSGDLNVFYSTTDAPGQVSNILVGNSGSGTLFDKDSSAADVGLNLNISADLAKNDLVTVSAGAGYTVLSTLGLENNFVSNVWGGAHDATLGTGGSYAKLAGGAKVENANWLNEAWVAVAAGKSTVKLGRMELDTPLAFTEKWSIEKNTFEAAVLINQDIPDTTVVAAFVGTGNGTETFGTGATNSNFLGLGVGVATGTNLQGDAQTLGLAVGPVVNGNGEFGTYGTDGAYAFGVINNSVESLTLQAWYYDVTKVAQAYWLQADVNIEGIMVGAQYNAMDLADFVGTSVYAVMVGYEMKDMLTAKVAYSSVDKDFAAGFNTATATGTAQSKLYTEAWWSRGQVTAADASAINLTITSPVQGIVDLGLYVTMVDHAAANSDLTEIALTASKSFGPLDATLAYINVDTDGSSAVNTVQAYLTVNF
ncbi:hypothetical protein [Sulfurimonas sp.]|uniref:hypothetical protein n=1 Tax=Sulfurimonas sp. TaxID=2022749 RepID=UPI0025E99AEB|nr:hypothetical protein [Sulfurimonas sp.]MBW6489142.1 hypothetical protein [Sulfurimonas sp.]